MRAVGRRMGPDTEHLRIDKAFSPIRCGAAGRAALLFLICFVTSFPATGRAQEKDVVLPESGIHYPGGFDPNTVGEVRGTVYEISRPSSGPVQFRLDTGRESYTVLTSPGWYWNDLSASITDKAEVVVQGSKSMGKDGRLYIVAQEVRNVSNGQSLAFRDEDGSPLWKGGGRGPGGPRGGTGSSPGGMGGMRGGPGGMGRGGRR
jgi:hypothetical protein